jgi:hypothetical protein
LGHGRTADTEEELTLKEFGSLLAIGLARGNRAPAISIEHGAKLTMLGYVVDLAGGLRITTRGRLQIETDISKQRTIRSVATPICTDPTGTYQYGSKSPASGERNVPRKCMCGLCQALAGSILIDHRRSSYLSPQTNRTSLKP